MTDIVLGNADFPFKPWQSYITLEDGTIIQDLDEHGMSAPTNTSLLQWEYIAQNDDREEVRDEAVRQAIETAALLNEISDVDPTPVHEPEPEPEKPNVIVMDDGS